jgi:3-dehydroquinate synthetase
MTFAITLLDNPVILANEHSLAHAIETLQTGKFWQFGRESVAVGKVEDNIEIISEEDTEDEKSIH